MNIHTLVDDCIIYITHFLPSFIERLNWLSLTKRRRGVDGRSIPKELGLYYDGTVSIADSEAPDLPLGAPSRDPLTVLYRFVHGIIEVIPHNFNYESLVVRTHIPELGQLFIDLKVGIDAQDMRNAILNTSYYIDHDACFQPPRYYLTEFTAMLNDDEWWAGLTDKERYKFEHVCRNIANNATVPIDIALQALRASGDTQNTNWWLHKRHKDLTVELLREYVDVFHIQDLCKYGLVTSEVVHGQEEKFDWVELINGGVDIGVVETTRAYKAGLFNDLWPDINYIPNLCQGLIAKLFAEGHLTIAHKYGRGRGHKNPRMTPPLHEAISDIRYIRSRLFANTIHGRKQVITILETLVGIINCYNLKLSTYRLILRTMMGVINMENTRVMGGIGKDHLITIGRTIMANISYRGVSFPVTGYKPYMTDRRGHIYLGMVIELDDVWCMSFRPPPRTFNELLRSPSNRLYSPFDGEDGKKYREDIVRWMGKK